MKYRITVKDIFGNETEEVTNVLPVNHNFNNMGYFVIFGKNLSTGKPISVYFNPRHIVWITFEELVEES